MAVIGVGLIVASEYRFTPGRSQEAALEGSSSLGNLLEFGAYGLAAAFLLLAIAQPPRSVRSPAPLIAMWAFTFASALGSLWSPYGNLASVRSVQLIIVAWFAQLIAKHANRAHLWLLCHAYAAVIAFSAVSGLAIHNPGEGQEGRYTWLYLHPNISGSLLALAVVVSLGCLLHRGIDGIGPQWPTWAYWLTFGINALGLVGTKSRGAIAGAVVGVILVAWNASRRRSRVDLTVLGIAGVGALWLLAAGNILTYLARGDSSEELSTLSSRTGVWEQGLGLFWERPLLGHGFMSARGAFLDTFGLGGAHNSLIEVMVNSGAFGTLTLLILLLVVLSATLRLSARRHPDGPLLVGLLAALLVNAFTGGELAQAASAQNIWLFIIVGWTAVIARAGDRPAPHAAQPERLALDRRRGQRTTQQ